VGAGLFSLDLGLPKPAPLAEFLEPTYGSVGSAVLITGQNLLGVQAVSFNRTPAAHFIGRGPDRVLAVVPPGATSGPITVTATNGVSTTGASFTID